VQPLCYKKNSCYDNTVHKLTPANLSRLQMNGKVHKIRIIIHAAFIVMMIALYSRRCFGGGYLIHPNFKPSPSSSFSSSFLAPMSLVTVTKHNKKGKSQSIRNFQYKSSIRMMPEGPECRVLVDQLQPAVGMRLINLKFLSGRYVAHGPPASFQSFRKTMTNYQNNQKGDKGGNFLLDTDKVVKWSCKGKFIYIQLDSGCHYLERQKDYGEDFLRSIWITLGMSGRFLNEAHPRINEARWYFEFLDTQNGNVKRIYYHDTRNFGTLKFSLSSRELEQKLSSLGFDLLDKETTEELFLSVISKTTERMNICKFLMNQKKISGIGNYLLAEGLYKASVDPFASLAEIDEQHLRKLFQVLRETSQNSYRAQGVTRPGGTFSDTNGKRGKYQFELECYGKQFCPRGEEIIREIDGPHGRTIWYVKSQLFMRREDRGQLKRIQNPNLDDNLESSIISKPTIMEYLVDDEWKLVLSEHMQSSSFIKISQFLEQEWESGEVYPPREEIFSALNLTPFSHVKVVILGQDPYHGHGQGHGLAFSVRRGITIPPSLKNIFRELHDDVGARIPQHGNLENWSKAGVLLLNTVLTVRKGKANSHANKGWEEFTDEIIQKISTKRDGIVFLLWGRSAAAKQVLIDRQKHEIIFSSHPSPLSARKTESPFLGSRCFSRANDALIRLGHHEPINWRLI